MEAKSEAIVERLCRVAKEPLDADVRGWLLRDAQRYLEDGWTEEEAFAHLRLCENVSPDVSEEDALRRMQVIAVGVKARKAALCAAEADGNGGSNGSEV